MLNGADLNNAEWLSAVAHYEGDTRLDLLAEAPERVRRLGARIAELEAERDQLRRDNAAIIEAYQVDAGEVMALRASVAELERERDAELETARRFAEALEKCRKLLGAPLRDAARDEPWDPRTFYEAMTNGWQELQDDRDRYLRERDAAEERVRAAERADVVAWLRVDPEAGGIEHYGIIARTADAIERGAHIKPVPTPAAPKDCYDELSDVIDAHPIGMLGVRR